MKRSTIRFLILAGIITIVGTVVIQVYFLQVTFNYEQRKLDQKIQVALWDVVNKLYEFNNAQQIGFNPVYQYSSDYYIVNVNDFIDATILEHYLIKTFEQQNIQLSFEYAIYDCQTDKMVYGNHINLGEKLSNPLKIEMPKHNEFVYYFGIYFPNRKKAVFGNFGLTYVISGVLILVTMFFGYALIIILKQRRFSELQNDVVNNLTHEFKTPLSSIILSSEVLNDDNIVNEPFRIKRYSQIIKEQANYLLQHVEKLLGMSELQYTKKLEKERIDLHQYIKDIVEEISSRGLNKNARFELFLNASDSFIYADKFHFSSLIFNILDNAIKYSNNEPFIEISSNSDKKNIILIVRDNGLGIDKKYQKKIFKKFFRIPTGNVHNVKGFGLGLSYVKDIIKQHRWKMRFKSEPCKGTTFMLTIPLTGKYCER